MNPIRTPLRSLGLLLATLGLAAGLAVGAPAEAQRGPRRPAAADAPDAPDGVVNIQTATVEQLQLLPGIGPSKASAIVAHRERRSFRRVEDLLRVRGIGRATFRRLRRLITVEGPTTLEPPRRTRPSEE